MADTHALTVEEIEDQRRYWQQEWMGSEESPDFQRRMTLCDMALRSLASAGRYASGLPLDPTEEMIEAGAQRLVRWETGNEKWPESWSKMDVRAARNDAERVWRSMYLEAVNPKGANNG